MGAGKQQERNAVLGYHRNSPRAPWPPPPTQASPVPPPPPSLITWLIFAWGTCTEVCDGTKLVLCQKLCSGADYSQGWASLSASPWPKHLLKHLHGHAWGPGSCGRGDAMLSKQGGCISANSHLAVIRSLLVTPQRAGGQLEEDSYHLFEFCSLPESS